MKRQTRTVLVTGDGRRDEESCRLCMREAGYDLLYCEQPSDAAIVATRQHPHLIVMEMPESDAAVAWISSLRSNSATQDIPVLLLSREPACGQVEVALQAGADDYLSIPFTPQDFRIRAERATQTRQSREVERGSQARLQRKVEALTLLHGFYEDILASDTVENTCRQSVETAAQLMGSQRVSMLLADARTHSLQFAHAVGMDRSIWNGRQVSLSSPVAGRVMATRREIVVNDKTVWPRQARYHNSQFISMPLIRGGAAPDEAILGVLNVTDHRDGRDYEPQDVLALGHLTRAAAFAIDAVRTRRRLDATRDSIIFSLAKLSEHRHPSTGKHLERVRELSLLLARCLAGDPRVTDRVDNQFVTDLGRAAPLHDVGKVATPDRILLKEGTLTAEEFAVIRDHTGIGAATLQSVMSAGHEDSFLKMAMEIAHFHHERYDGTGYPRGLAGEQIPLSARIVCLADSYDAIRTAREYKPARTHEEAARELRLGSGTQFDPIVVQAFCAVEDQFQRIYNNLMEKRATSGSPSDALIPLAVGA